MFTPLGVDLPSTTGGGGNLAKSVVMYVTWPFVGDVALSAGESRMIRRNGRPMSLNNGGDEITLFDGVEVIRESVRVQHVNRGGLYRDGALGVRWQRGRAANVNAFTNCRFPVDSHRMQAQGYILFRTRRAGAPEIGDVIAFAAAARLDLRLEHLWALPWRADMAFGIHRATVPDSRRVSSPGNGVLGGPLVSLIFLALVALNCIKPLNADRPHNYTAEQRWSKFSSLGTTPYPNTSSISRNVDYWCVQNLGEELSSFKLYTPRNIEDAADPPSYDFASCLYFYLDPAVAQDHCLTAGIQQTRIYAEHMRMEFDLTDSTDRVVFIVHPTLEAIDEYTLGRTDFVAVGDPAAGYIETAAFVFRDRADAKVQEVWGYPAIGGEEVQKAYERALIRATSLSLMHEFGHLCFGLWHADYDSLSLEGNSAHNMDGPLGRCVMESQFEYEDITTDYGSRWRLHFCENNGTYVADSCRKRIRAKYGL